MKKLKIITVQPSDLYFSWSNRVFLHNLRKYGLSEKAEILIFIPHGRSEVDYSWKELWNDYPETKFFVYHDEDNLTGTQIKDYNYIPLLRPYTLIKHFKAYPELSECTIYYTDADTCFTQYPSFLFGDMIQDDINYYSFCGNRETGYNYQNVTYLDSKVTDVLPEKLEEYKKIDVVQGMLDIFGLKREFAEENNMKFGGCQYLFKGITSDFWQAIYSGCIYLKRYLGSVNRLYFASEDKGFQSWCSDLWSIQFNLWRLGMKCDTVPILDFAWATDPIEKWEKHIIYHDAGAGHGSIAYIEGSEQFLFFKRKQSYINNENTPFDEDLSFVSPHYCSYNYVREIEQAAPIKEEVKKLEMITFP